MGRKTQAAKAAKAKPVVPVSTISDDHRAILDPEVRKVAAMREQVNREQQRLDSMVKLVYPKWGPGFTYSADTGGIYRTKDVSRLEPPADPNAKPVEALD